MTPHPSRLRISRRAFSIATCLIGLVIAHVGNAQQKSDSLHYFQEANSTKPGMDTCEVLIYGGTPSGVAAAIQSAREGRKTILVSFNRFVGGLISAGLTATDIGDRKTIGGIANEFYNRIGTIKDYSPAAGEALFRKMLDEAGVRLYLNEPLDHVNMENGRIRSLSTIGGITIEAKVFIDSSYEGDLLAAANVSYHVGREPQSTYGESLAGQWQKRDWHSVYQFCNLPISPYRIADDPTSGLLPEITDEPQGASGDGDYRLQAFNFRMFLSNQEGKLPFPKPAGYDADRYALLARFLNFSPDLKWTLNYTTRPMTDGPVQMRNGDSNNAGSFSSDYIGGNHRWADGTYSPEPHKQLPPPRRGLRMPMRELYQIREAIFQDHVNYQQGLMFFLANDPQVPQELQARVKQFGLDPNEFKSTAHWPHALYVREARRLLSDYVMTQQDCESKRVAEDPIAMASYNMDSHFCQRSVVIIDGKVTVRNDGAFGLKCPQAYPISYRSIVPKKSECTNLLVPLCLSSSHVAYGSIRMEPVFKMLGQSAGTAASMSIAANCAVQDLAYTELRDQLIHDGQILSLKSDDAKP